MKGYIICTGTELLLGKTLNTNSQYICDEFAYENLYESATSRAIADWLVGINLSRLYSCLYKQNYSVGRVQTPTLTMIVERDESIRSFIKEKYFTVDLCCGDFTLSTERIDDEEVAKRILESVGSEIAVDDVIQKEKITSPDNPYDLTTLQREANKYFGFSAKQTLDYAQSLYEKKLITYPRTDSRFLTEDMRESTVDLIFLIDEGIEIDDKNINSIFNSKKVSDHHAIIPTTISLSYENSLSESERKLFKLIKLKLLMSVSKNLIESTTKIVATVNGTNFCVNGKTIIQDGFSSHLKEFSKKQNKEEVLPVLNKGDYIKIISKDIKEKYTNPPKHFTEESLLKAMELAGTEEIDKGIEVERKGLGTPATRAGIIENLIYKSYIERDKKNLFATHKGVALAAIVEDNFKSASTTAQWEMKLSEIANGDANSEEFLMNIESEIKKLVSKYQK